MKYHNRKNARLASFLRKALKPLFAVCALAPVFGFHTASAQLIWQGTNPPQNGGDGTWDLATPNWGNAAPPGGALVWVQGDTATFGGGTPGTVTISSIADTGAETGFPDITASGLGFTVGTTAATGYNITDDFTARLFLTTGTATPTIISVSTGKFATISTNINSATTDSLSIQGGGTLIVSGANAGSYLGTTVTISGGTTLQAAAGVLTTGNGAFPSTADYIVSSGTLDLNNTIQSIATLSTPTTAATPGAVVTNSNTTPNPNNAATTYAMLTVGGVLSPSSASLTTFGGTITDTSTTIETGATATIAGGNPTPAGGLGLTIVGSGNPAGYTLALTGTNSYHGITTIGNGGNPAAIQAGVAGVGVANALSPNSVVDVEGNGTLDLYGANQGIAGLSGTGAGTVTTTNGAATLTLGATPTGGTTALTAATTLYSAANLVDNNANALSLTKTGAYTQVLSGTNTYSGATTVTQGTLAGGSAGGLSAKSDYTVTTPGVLDLNGNNVTMGSLAGTGTVTNGSGNVLNPAGTAIAMPTGTNTLTTGSAGSTTFSGAITDGTANIALVKVGSGTTFNITGANTYSGGTTLGTTGNAGGTLSFAQGSLGTGTVTFAGNSTLQFNQTNGAVTTDPSSAPYGITINSNVTATFDTNNNPTPINFGSALTTNPGSAVQKNGLGTLTLNGNNTYNGATTVNAGTLQAGGAVGGFTGFSPNSAYTVNPGGTLDVNGLTPTIGSLASPAASPTAVVTNTGATPGTLITGMDNTPTTFSGTLQDGGVSTLALTKIGTGTFTLNSDNTFSGGTTLSAGALVIGSSNALGKGNVAVNGGILQTGGANMLINVGGNYTQAAGGELDLRIGGTAPGTFDRVAVTGNASLNGRLNVAAVNGYVPKVGDTQTVITAAGGGGVSGTFAQVVGSLTNVPMITLTVTYLPGSVVLNYLQASFLNIPTPATLAAIAAGIPTAPRFIQLTPNQKAVAGALNHLSPNFRSTRLLNVLDSLPVESLPHAFDLIAPEEYGVIYEISRSAAKIQLVTIDNRLDAVHATSTPTTAAGPAGPSDGKGSKEIMPPPENRLGVFANGSGEFVTVGDSFNAAGYNFASGAVTAGVDYRFTEHFVAGALFNYTRTSADLVDNGRLNANAFRGGLYASLFGAGAYVNGYVGGGYNDYDASRAGLGGSVRGSTNGGDFNALISSGYDAHAGNLTFGPVASFQYTYTGLNSFNETGSLDPLHINSGHGESLLTNVGFRATYDCHIGSMVLVPEVRATWQHEYGNTFDEVSAAMLVGSPNFTVTDSPIGRDSLVVYSGFTLRITPELSAYAFYDGELARTHYQANNVLVGLRSSF